MFSIEGNPVSLKKKVMKRAFCMPEGIVGRIGGRLMSLDRELPAWVLSLLDLRPSDSLLEIGPGPGVAVELAATRARRVVAVDASETMLAMARRRNRVQIESGRVELRLGSVDDLPFDDDTFDASMAINCLHLWPDSVRGLKELARILRPGGRIAVAISRFSYASPDPFEMQLSKSGFIDVSIQRGDRGTCALGRLGL
jgi:ubiquinone/menaquinone biosynthesis C-methylase UbiE